MTEIGLPTCGMTLRSLWRTRCGRLSLALRE